MKKEDLLKTLKSVGQEHLVSFFEELNAKEKANLMADISSINFDQLPSLIKDFVLKKPKQKIPADLKPAQYFPIEAENDKDAKIYLKAYDLGQKLISDGKVALCTVAGGQGTRLGFDGPKGTYGISPIKNKSLFQLFAEQILGLEKKYKTELHWYIMTSNINNSATEKFFKENKYFGLKKSQVFFFVQGLMPVIDYQGKILLASKSSLQMSPDGHGGTLLALKKSGALAEMKELGIEYLSYFQVDNPLVSVIDPLFIGFHKLEKSDVSSRSLTKTGPFEKLGNFCMTDSKLTIIEYSDMPEKFATKMEKDGKLAYRAGSPAIHVFSRKFVDKVTSGKGISMPFHRADKKVAFIDSKGKEVVPIENNAVKLETFIFDAIPLAKNPIILEAVREEQFAPVKNSTGVDSAESCREMSQEKDALWLEQAGLDIPRKKDGKLNCKIEINKAVYPDINSLTKVSNPKVKSDNYYG